MTLEDLGNYLVAGRDLEAGALVLDEESALLGPAEEQVGKRLRQKCDNSDTSPSRRTLG